MPSHLLNIPKEILDQIFEYCLLVEGEINSYPTRFEKEDGYVQKRPSAALLSVNEALRAHAAPILYGKNIWRISNDFNWDVFSYDRSKGALKGWQCSWWLIRHVTISFDYRDYDPSSMLQISREALENECTSLEPAELADWIHDRRKGKAYDWWYGRAAWILDPPLESLEVDCPSGCCRMSKNAVRCVNRITKWDGYTPVTFVGLVPAEYEGHMHNISGSICSECVEPRDKPWELSCLKGSRSVDRRARRTNTQDQQG